MVSFKVGGHERCCLCFLPLDTVAFGEAVQAVYIAGLSFFRNCQDRNFNDAVWKNKMNSELLKGEGRNSRNLLHLNRLKKSNVDAVPKIKPN